MRNLGTFVLAATVTAGIATPALADWDRIGSIDVTYNVDHDSVSPDFGGPVERLQFTARGSDIQCSFIRATFSNGRDVELFSGRLAQNASRSVDLPGAQQNVRKVTTRCRAFQRSGSKIEIAADIGQYRDTWRRSPNWSQVWARMFNWANQPGIDQSVNYWVPITTLHFSGRGDKDGAAGGWAGKSISSIGLKPNRDARCSRITVIFGNGRRSDLGARTLAANATARFDLPGSNDRNISQLSVACHAVTGYNVDIAVYGRK